MLLLLAACDPPPPEGCAYASMSLAPRLEEQCPDGAATVTATGLAPLVVMFTVDTFNRAYTGGRRPDFNASPRIDDFYAQSTYFPAVVTTRSLTGVALSSLLTGLYPKDHGVRSHADQAPTTATTLPERFAAAGYRTLAYSANQCWLVDGKVDEVVCHWNRQGTQDQHDADTLLVDAAVDRLGRLDGPTFMWIHLVDPHAPYEAREPHYSDFGAPDAPGEFDPGDEGALADVNLGTRAITAEEHAQVEAAYASQVAAVDNLFGRLLDALDANGQSDAVVLLGADHGEELGLHGHYYWHSCSTYNPAMVVSYALRAPGRLAPGGVVTTPVPIVDLAPTLAEVAGLQWSGDTDGTSLVGELRSCRVESRPAFFERDTKGAGMVLGDQKVVIEPEGKATDCTPYSAEAPYVVASQQLYDLADDPDECTNLADDDPTTFGALREQVCDWVTSGAWVESNNDRNVLVKACGG